MGAEIFQSFLQAPKSVMDYENEYADATARRQSNAIRAMAMQQQVDQRNEALGTRNALQRVAAGWTPETTMDQRIASLRGDPRLWGQADALEKTSLERRKTEADIGKTTAEADKTKDAMSADRYRRNVQQLMALGGPQEAISGLQQQMQRGEVDPNMGALLLKSVPQDPAAFNAWKLQMVASLGDPKAMVEMLKPHLQTVDLGGSKVQQAVDPLTGRAATTGSMQVTQSPDNAATVGATLRGQSLTDARAREGLRLQADSQGGYEYKQDADGNWVALPKKPGAGPIVGNPVMSPDGKTPLAGSQGKAPTDFMKGMTGINELTGALNTYETALRDAGGASSMALGEKRAKLQAAYTSLKMGLKNAFELGALTGPDVAVLEGMLIDPTSPKLMLIGDKGVTEQIAQTRSYLKNREGALESTYSRTNPAKKGAAPAPAAAPKVVDFGSLK